MKIDEFEPFTVGITAPGAGLSCIAELVSRKIDRCLRGAFCVAMFGHETIPYPR